MSNNQTNYQRKQTILINAKTTTIELLSAVVPRFQVNNQWPKDFSQAITFKDANLFWKRWCRLRKDVDRPTACNTSNDTCLLQVSGRPEMRAERTATYTRIARATSRASRSPEWCIARSGQFWSDNADDGRFSIETQRELANRRQSFLFEMS